MPPPGSDRIVSRPPSASTRSRSRSSPASDREPSSVDLEDDRSVLVSHGHGRSRPGARVLERLETAPVDRRRDLGRVPRSLATSRVAADAGAPGRRAQRCGEAARLEQRRVDPLRELRRLVQRLLHVARQLVEERFRRRGIGVRRARSASWRLTASATRCCCTPLVQFALDHAAVGVGGKDESPPGCAQLRDLETQPVELFPAARRAQPPGRSTSSSSSRLRKLSVIAPAASSGPAPPCVGRAASRRTRLPPP